jgi:dCMP deaminase
MKPKEEMNHQERWDRRYLELAKYVANNWSRDPSTKVGAVVVNWKRQREFIGYNGFPPGVLDLPKRYENRELKYLLVSHAETNAIRKAGMLARGATLYVYPAFALPPCCNECAKDAIHAGIREVVGYEPDMTDPRVLRWLESIKISQMMFTEAGITWRSLKETT